jgi:predicted DNA-binding protein
VEYLEKQIAELENDLFLLKFALRQIRDDQKMPESARKAAGNALKVVEG